MDVIFSKEIDGILKKGHFLLINGVNNWALSKADALNCLNRFLEMKVPVLGGDVCQLIEGQIRHNNDSWYCDPSKGESRNEFLIRSISVAKTYIMQYRSIDMENVYFILVPEV